VLTQAPTLSFARERPLWLEHEREVIIAAAHDVILAMDVPRSLAGGIALETLPRARLGSPSAAGCSGDYSSSEDVGFNEATDVRGRGRTSDGALSAFRLELAQMARRIARSLERGLQRLVSSWKRRRRERTMPPVASGCVWVDAQVVDDVANADGCLNSLHHGSVFCSRTDGARQRHPAAISALAHRRWRVRRRPMRCSEDRHGSCKGRIAQAAGRVSCLSGDVWDESEIRRRCASRCPTRARSQ
jgi:hypothetical protein